MSTHIPALSTDALIIAAIALVAVFGFMAGVGLLARLAISIYVGLVLVNSFGPTFHATAVKGIEHGPFGLTLTMTNLLLFVIPIVLLQFGRHGAHPHKKGHHLLTLLLGALTSMLLISSIITVLDPLSHSRVLTDSNLASQIYSLNLVWVVAVPLAIGALAFIKPKHPH
jgi:hypothetical protein